MDYSIIKQKDDEQEEQEYIQWLHDNESEILEEWRLTEPEAPDDIYIQVLDDDYCDTYDKWLEETTIQDVPEEYIKELWNKDWRRKHV